MNDIKATKKLDKPLQARKNDLYAETPVEEGHIKEVNIPYKQESRIRRESYKAGIRYERESREEREKFFSLEKDIFLSRNLAHHFHINFSRRFHSEDWLTIAGKLNEVYQLLRKIKEEYEKLAEEEK